MRVPKDQLGGGKYLSTPCIDLLCKGLFGLLRGKKRVLVATSGGPDSQALLDCLAQLRARFCLTLWALGVDHNLRPDAGAELDKAQALAASHDIAFARVTLGPLPPGNRLNAARQARRNALLAHARAVGAEAIAVGHTADDQAETLLMHLVRGTASAGLAGMPSRNGLFIRPLLDVSRNDIIAHLRSREILWATDPSNTHPARARAMLRQAVMPALNRLNRQSVKHMAAGCIQARADHRWLIHRAAKALQKSRRGAWGLDTSRIGYVAWALFSRVLALWLASCGALVSRSAVKRLGEALRLGPWRGSCQPSVGKLACIHLVGGRVERSGMMLRFVRTAAGSRPRVPMPSRCVAVHADIWPAHHAVTWGPWQLKSEIVTWPDAKLVADPRHQGPLTVAFDADRLHVELAWRHWQPGDRLAPFGLVGQAKVSDLFINAKVPRHLRVGWPILVGGDTLFWVAGLRRGAMAPITDKTRRVLVVSAKRGEQEPAVTPGGAL